MAGGWADLGSSLGLDGVLKNGVGGLNALGVEVLGVDSVLGLHIVRFKSQRGGIGGGRGGIESSDGDRNHDGVLEKDKDCGGVLEGDEDCGDVLEGDGDRDGVQAGGGDRDGVLKTDGDCEDVLEGDGDRDGVLEGEGGGV